MIYYNFKNYEEFKELFGIVEHGNGVKSRKNKILLALYKDKRALHEHAQNISWRTMNDLFEHHHDKYLGSRSNSDFERKEFRLRKEFGQRVQRMRAGFTLPTNMTELKVFVTRMLTKYGCGEYEMTLNGVQYRSDTFSTDDRGGICEDGDERQIREFNHKEGKVKKIKAGRLLNHLFECCPMADALPEQVKRWYSEVWVGDWIAYARENGCGEQYELHVDENYEDIYDSSRCKGDFHSCMVNNGNWRFYRDAVDAKAAYLTDADDMIVARCIIYTDVYDQDGNVWRLAERQYSTDCDDNLKRILVNRLYAGGHIDGHKAIGASCSDGRNFVDGEGNSLRDKRFRISCHLENDDIVSYQDSFKDFNYEEQEAYNYSSDGIDLAITGGYVEIDNHQHECYSNYNEEWIDENDAYYVESRDDYFYVDQVVYAENICEDCFKDDCIQIGSNFYFAGINCEYPADNGIYYCEQCDEYYLEDDAVYSEITGEYYCSEYCRNEAEQEYKEDHWDYSEYDEEYFEDGVVDAQIWNVLTFRYESTTIHESTLAEFFENGEAVEIDGVVYIDEIGFDGEPAHFCAAELRVA